MSAETLYATGHAGGSVASPINVLGPPDGQFTSDTGNVSWTARFAMGNPVGSQANGTHTITLRVRKQAGQSGTPSVASVALYDGGTLIATISTGSRQVTNTGAGSDLLTNFDSSLLAGRNLANVEVEVATTAAGGNPSSRCAVQLDSITWTGDFTTVAATPRQGSSTGTHTWAGAADGTAPAAVNQGAGSGAHAWAGTADGIAPATAEPKIGGPPVISNLAAGGSNGTANLAAYSSGSVTPAAGAVVLASITVYATGSTNPGTPTCSGLGLAWTLLGSVNFDSSGSDRGTVFLFIGEGAATSGQVTFTFPAAVAKVNYVIDQATDVGAAPVVQTVTAQVASGSTSISTNLAAYADPANIAYAVLGVQGASGNVITPGAGETLVATAQTTSYCLDASMSSADTALSATWNNGGPAGIIAVELAAASVTPSNGIGEALGGFAFDGQAFGPQSIVLPGWLSDPAIGFPVEPESQSHLPAYMDGNGNLYRVMEGPVDDPDPLTPCMYKSTDRGQTWTEVDGAGRPSGMDDQEGCWAWQDGTSIFYAMTPGPDKVAFAEFHTSDHPTDPDSWASTETVRTAASGSGVGQWVSVSHLSDGSKWFFYADVTSGGNQQITYRKRNSNGTYGAEVKAAFGGTGVSVSNPVVVADANDTTWIFYTDNTNNRVLYRKLTAAGSLDAAGTRLDTTGRYLYSTDYCRGEVAAPVRFDNAGVDTIAAAYAESNGNLWLAVFEDGLLTREQVTTAAVAGGAGNSTSENITAHVALDGTTLHIVYTDSATGEIRYRKRAADGTYAAEQTIVTPDGTTPPDPATDPAGEGPWSTCQYVYANAYTYPDGQKVLGVVYERGPHDNSYSFVQYTHVVLPSDAPAPMEGAASGAFVFAGTASGTKAASGAAAGVHAWAGAAEGSAPKAGSAAGTFAWAGAADGERTPKGAASGGHAWAGTADGVAPTVGMNGGAAAGAVSWAGTADGSRVSSGGAAGTVAWAGSADGERTPVGSAAGGHSWAGTADGLQIALGDAAGGHTWAGEATGKHVPAGDAAGAFAWAGTAGGVRHPEGTAVSGHAWEGTATGQAPLVGVSSGNAAGRHRWAGSAEGSAEHTGDTTGGHAWVGTADGTRIPKGAAAGGHSWAGAADGTAPVVAGAGGSAAGTHTWSAVGEGARQSAGSTTAEHVWSGVSTGEAPLVGVNQGSAAGTFGWAGVVDGTTTREGAASGQYAYEGRARGGTGVGGEAAGMVAWSGVAEGKSPTSGETVATHAWSGVAGGQRRPKGVGTSGHAWTGTAAGEAPYLTPNTGSASGEFLFSTRYLVPIGVTTARVRRHQQTAVFRTRPKQAASFKMRPTE